jgi:hypothetical protein
MERQIATLSYWLGLASAVIALLLRACNALGILVPHAVVQGQTVWYMSFYKGALLFFLIAIASTWRQSQRS